MASLGFDRLADSSRLRAPIQKNALGTRLCRVIDMHARALGKPLLEKGTGKERFHLMIGVERSRSLKIWTPLMALSPNYDESKGLIHVVITPDGLNTQFFRVIGKGP